MVFSQTDANPQSFLKVVELNLLKNRKVNGTTGAIIGGSPQTPTLPAPVATTSFSEVSDSRSVSMLIIAFIYINNKFTFSCSICQRTVANIEILHFQIFLKPEPHESTMFHESDSELFRDLAPWCVQPAEETVQTGIGKKVLIFCFQLIQDFKVYLIELKVAVQFL